MRIKTNQKITVEDFPAEQKQWIAKLVSPINNFIQEAVALLNDGLQYPDNFICKDHEFAFKYQSNEITFPIGFQWKLAVAPKAFQVVSATEDGEPLNCSCAFKYAENGQVQLVSVVKFDEVPTLLSLEAGSQYKIRVRVTP